MEQRQLRLTQRRKVTCVAGSADAVDRDANVFGAGFGKIVAIAGIRTPIGCGRQRARRRIKEVVRALSVEDLLHHERRCASWDVFVEEQHGSGLADGSADDATDVEGQERLDVDELDFDSHRGELFRCFLGYAHAGSISNDGDVGAGPENLGYAQRNAKFAHVVGDAFLEPVAVENLDDERRKWKRYLKVNLI